MKIAFVLHDLSLTGAPILGFNIAKLLSKNNDVVLIAKKNGPLEERIKSSGIRLLIINTSHEVSSEELSSRRASGVDLIKNEKFDFVYVNSLASADWVSIACDLNISHCLHVHEAENAILELMKVHIFDTVAVSKCKKIISASRSSQLAFSKFFSYPLKSIYNFDVAINVDETIELSRDVPFNPIRSDGSVLDLRQKKFKSRKLICMCGTAQKRKGADLFWRVAQKRQDCDFVWIGPWDQKNVRDFNPAYQLNEVSPLPNLYWTNELENPYPNIRASDLMILTSVEDPNPLVVLESLCINTPVITFTKTGNSHIYTSLFAFSLSHEPSVHRISNYIDIYLHFWNKRHYISNDTLDNFKEKVDLSRRVEIIERLINDRSISVGIEMVS